MTTTNIHLEPMRHIRQAYFIERNGTGIEKNGTGIEKNGTGLKREDTA